MARPVKPAFERRTMILKARCSPGEKQRIEEIAAAVRLSVSDYLRTLGLHGGGPVRQAEAFPPALVFELNKIGVNLNQIAYKLNATGQPVPADLSRSLERLSGFLDALLMASTGEERGHGPEPDER